MFGAEAYLMARFELTKEQSISILRYWMDTYVARLNEKNWKVLLRELMNAEAQIEQDNDGQIVIYTGIFTKGRR